MTDSESLLEPQKASEERYETPKELLTPNEENPGMVWSVEALKLFEETSIFTFAAF
jgi:hypothetical protein